LQGKAQESREREGKKKEKRNGRLSQTEAPTWRRHRDESNDTSK